MVNNKFYPILSLLSLCSFTGCQSQLTVNETAKIQARVIPAVISSDEKVFIESTRVAPNDITKRIYDSAVEKALYLQLSEQQVGNNYQIEQDAHINQINSLCIMGKFLLNPTYEKPSKTYMQAENYQNLFIWLKIKQPKWESLLKQTKIKFNNPCLDLDNVNRRG